MDTERRRQNLSEKSLPELKCFSPACNLAHPSLLILSTHLSLLVQGVCFKVFAYYTTSPSQPIWSQQNILRTSPPVRTSTNRQFSVPVRYRLHSI